MPHHLKRPAFAGKIHIIPAEACGAAVQVARHHHHQTSSAQVLLHQDHPEIFKLTSWTHSKDGYATY